MSLEEVNHLSQTISAVAILASLIFVALQLRRAEKYQRALMHQGRAALVVDAFLRAAEGPAAELLAKARSGTLDFTPLEIAQLTMGQRAINELFFDTLTQHENKLVDHATFEQAQNWGRTVMALPVMRAVWQLNRHTYSTKLAEVVDRTIIKDVPLATPISPDALKDLLASAVGPTDRA